MKTPKIDNIYQHIKGHTRNILTGAILIGALALGSPLYVMSQDFLRRGETEKKLTQLENSLSNIYGITIRVWPEPSEFDRRSHVRQTSLRSHSTYLSLKALEGLEKALQHYPKKLLQENLKQIEIVRAYTTSTEDIMKQGATPVANVSWWGGMSISAGRDDFLRYHRAVLGTIFEKESFDHELAHLLTSNIPREEWRTLHLGAIYNPSTWTLLDSIPNGFFNKYATHSISEDIASTAELLHSDDYYNRVSCDSILRKKAEYLKKWYFTISDGAINDEYWSAIQRGKIPEKTTT